MIITRPNHLRRLREESRAVEKVKVVSDPPLSGWRRDRIHFIRVNWLQLCSTDVCVASLNFCRCLPRTRSRKTYVHVKCNLHKRNILTLKVGLPCLFEYRHTYWIRISPTRSIGHYIRNLNTVMFFILRAIIENFSVCTIMCKSFFWRYLVKKLRIRPSVHILR